MSEDETGDQTAVAVGAAVTETTPEVLDNPVKRRRGRPPKSAKSDSVTPSANSASKPPRQKTVASHSISKTGSACKSDVNTPVPRVGRMAPKTIIKGNILYQRTETGEVIASVIKNGVTAKNDTDKMPSVMLSTPRGRPPGLCQPVTSSWLGDDVGIPADCPVHENNVEDVLDQSIVATQTMRQILLSLKDDLRRMGGGTVMTPSLKPLHVQHRIDVADKLARAFTEYRETIDLISGSPSLPINDESEDSCLHDVQEQASSPSHTQQSSTSLVEEPVPKTNSSCDTTSASESLVEKPVPKTNSSGNNTASAPGSRRKSSAPVSSSKRRAVAKSSDVISGDLWMSCEPGCD